LELSTHPDWSPDFIPLADEVLKVLQQDAHASCQALEKPRHPNEDDGCHYGKPQHCGQRPVLPGAQSPCQLDYAFRQCRRGKNWGGKDYRIHKHNANQFRGHDYFIGSASGILHVQMVEKWASRIEAVTSGRDISVKAIAMSGQISNFPLGNPQIAAGFSTPNQTRSSHPIH